MAYVKQGRNIIEKKGRDSMKIAVNGADGRMGRVFCAYCEKMGIETVGIDPRLKIKTLSEVVDDCDVVVDFSDSGAVKEVCDFVSERKIPAVIATTGFCDGDLCRIRKVAEKIPVFLSANLSRGAAFLLFAMKKAEKFFPTADIEIIETHHSGKTDSPSGTALRLATSRPDLKISVGRNGKVGAKKTRSEYIR